MPVGGGRGMGGPDLGMGGEEREWSGRRAECRVWEEGERP